MYFGEIGEKSIWRPLFWYFGDIWFWTYSNRIKNEWDISPGAIVIP